MRFQSDVAALDAKYTKELADAVLKMMLGVMMLPLVVVGQTSKAVCQSVREAVIASGVDDASPDWQTLLNGIISPQREADHYAKTTGRKLRRVLMSSAAGVAHIDGQLMQLL